MWNLVQLSHHTAIKTTIKRHQWVLKETMRTAGLQQLHPLLVIALMDNSAQNHQWNQSSHLSVLLGVSSVPPLCPPQGPPMFPSQCLLTVLLSASLCPPQCLLSVSSRSNTGDSSQSTLAEVLVPTSSWTRNACRAAGQASDPLHQMLSRSVVTPQVWSLSIVLAPCPQRKTSKGTGFCWIKDSQSSHLG